MRRSWTLLHYPPIHCTRWRESRKLERNRRKNFPRRHRWLTSPTKRRFPHQPSARKLRPVKSTWNWDFLVLIVSIKFEIILFESVFFQPLRFPPSFWNLANSSHFSHSMFSFSHFAGFGRLILLGLQNFGMGRRKVNLLHRFSLLCISLCETGIFMRFFSSHFQL